MAELSPIAKAASRGWHHERLEIVPWAERKVYLPKSVTSLDGPYRVDAAPYQAEPLREMANDENEAVVLVKANQVGGSTIGVVSLGYWCDQDPGPAMWTTGNQDLARDFSKDILFPIFRRIATIDEAVLNNRVTASTYEIRLPSMTLLLAWGGSENKAEQKSVRYLILDEFEMYADLIAAFEKRTTRYSNSRKVYISKPGLLTGPAWTKYETTDQREWQWPCLGCGEMLPLKFKGYLFFDKFHHATGKPDYSRIFPTIRFVCPKCNHEHGESSALHSHILDHGRYIPQHPKANDGMKRKVVGFRWNAMLLPLIEGVPSWERLVKEFIEAEEALKTGSVLPLQAFLNKRMAEPFEDRTGVQDFSLNTTKIDSTTKWDREVMRFLIADKQVDHLWYLAGSFSMDGDCRLIEADMTRDELTLRDVQQRLGVADACTIVDAGDDAKTVYEWCQKFGWQAMKGEDDAYFRVETRPGLTESKLWKLQKTDPFIGTARQNRARFAVFLWSNPSVTSIIMRILAGKGTSLEIPEGFCPSFGQHLQAVQRVQRHDKDGRSFWTWVDRKGKPNHLLDCLRMLYTAAIIDSEMPKPHVKTRLGLVEAAP